MQPRPTRVVTVTVSDTRTSHDDRSGPVLAQAITAAGLVHVRHVLVPDEPARIQEEVRRVAGGEAEVVVLTGGTGIGPRDRTIEALEPLYRLTLDGFGETFRRLSFDEIGPRAILSRASAGVVDGCLVFALPGSPHAARLGIERLILPIVGHAVAQLAGGGRHEAP